MKALHSFSQILLGILVLLLSSCSTALYTPNAPILPQLANQGHTKLSAIYSPYGGDLNTAYGLTNNIGLMLNGGLHNHERTTTNIFTTPQQTVRKHNERMIEAGLGYYKALDARGRWRFDLYGGGGVGRMSERTPSNPSLQVDGDYSKFFLLSGIGINSNLVDFSLGCRLSYLQTGLVKSTDLALSNKKFSGLCYEPTTMLSIGWKQIKGFAQLSMLIPDGSADIALFDLDVFLTGRIGLAISLNGSKD
jgi:hypothetical protein